MRRDPGRLPAGPRGGGPRAGLEVEVPGESELREVLATLPAGVDPPRDHLSGADLEEAVSRSFRRCCRLAHGDLGEASEGGPRPPIRVTGDALAESLRVVRRSVTQDSMAQFLGEVCRYCGGMVAGEIAARFPEG